jgi:hypothetical protein
MLPRSAKEAGRTPMLRRIIRAPNMTLITRTKESSRRLEQCTRSINQVILEIYAYMIQGLCLVQPHTSSIILEVKWSMIWNTTYKLYLTPYFLFSFLLISSLAMISVEVVTIERTHTLRNTCSFIRKSTLILTWTITAHVTRWIDGSDPTFRHASTYVVVLHFYDCVWLMMHMVAEQNSP